MKRLIQIVTIAIIVLAPIAVGSSAFAASSCRIGYTGPDSNNLCTSSTLYTCTVNDNSNINIESKNSQVAISGNATTVNNGNGSTTTTGQATNDNSVTLSATVDNTGEEKTCTVVATVPATITPDVPAAAAVVATPPQKPTATVLPDTSSDTTISTLALLVTALGVSVILSRVGVVAYRHFKA